MDCIIFFPATGIARKFNSYNLAQATYPKLDIMTNPTSVVEVLKKFLRTNPKSEATIHDWYEALHINMEASGRYERTPDQKNLIVGHLHFPIPKYLDDETAEHMADWFWKLAVATPAIKAENTPSSMKRKGRPTGFTIDLVMANVVLDRIRARETKVPAQVRGIIEYLTQQEFDYYSAQEMQRAAESPAFHKQINSVQSGWRIWRYYTPLLRELEVIKS